MTAPKCDPLDQKRIVEGFDTELFGSFSVLDEVGSTNAELVTQARAGRQRAVLATEFQSAGRGRLGRVWTAPPRSGLAVSLLLTPTVPADRWTWLPLVIGLAVVDSLAVAELPASASVELKWPNDVLINGAKVAGILAERVDSGRVVVGVGLNVSLPASELPVPTATSLLLEGAGALDRSELLRAFFAAMSSQLRQWWAEPDDEAVRERYRDACSTIGREVTVELAGGNAQRGLAIGVDSAGALVVDLGSGNPLVVGAGDVQHVRPT